MVRSIVGGGGSPGPKKASPAAPAIAAAAVGATGVKQCTECGTQRTPMWRNGPAGPKTLCNACGVRAGRLRNSGRARAGGAARRSGGVKAAGGVVGSVGKAGLKRKAEGMGELGAGRRKGRHGAAEEGCAAGGVGGARSSLAQKKSHHKQVRPVSSRLHLPGGGEWVGDGSGGRAALGRLAGQRAGGRRAALLAGDTRIEVVRPGAMVGLNGGTNLLIEGKRVTGVTLSLTDDLQPGQTQAGVRLNVSHGGRMRTGYVIRPTSGDVEAAGGIGTLESAAPSQVAGGALPAPAAKEPTSPGVVTAEHELPGSEGSRNAQTGNWEWAVTPRWSLEFASREALHTVRAEVQRQLSLLAAASAVRPEQTRGATGPIAIPGVRPVAEDMEKDEGEGTSTDSEDEAAPRFQLPTSYIRRAEGAAGPTCAGRAHLYALDDDDREWLAQLTGGDVDCQSLVRSVTAGETHAASLAAARAGRPGVGLVPSRSPSCGAINGFVTGPATPSLAEGPAADPRQTPEPMETPGAATTMAAAATAAGAGAKEASTNSAGLALHGHEKEGSTGGGPVSGSEAADEGEDAQGGAVDQDAGLALTDFTGVFLSEVDLEKCVDALEQVSALTRRPFLGQAEALKLLRACPWAPQDEASLQVAHAYWLHKLQGRSFEALVAHYHRLPPPGWREPRVSTHAFEFVVGPPRPAERRAAIASKRRRVARRSGRGNPVLSLIEGLPIKHDHRSGVACLACRLKQLSKQEGVGPARAMLAAELGIGPDTKAALIAAAAGDGASDPTGDAAATEVPAGYPNVGLGALLSGAPAVALKVAQYTMGDAAAAKAKEVAAAREDSCSVGEQPAERELLPRTPGLCAPAPKRRRTPRARASSSVKRDREAEPILVHA